MNPDKLFDYLDGKLSPDERAELEAQLMSDPQLRQELMTAREIHSGMRKASETFDEPIPSLEQRGAILGRRVAVAFSVLVFANVLFGIYAVAFMKKKDHPRVGVERNRTEVTESLARTAAVALPTPSLEVEEIKFTAPLAEQNELANTIVDEAKAVGGSATKGLADEHGILIFAEIPAFHLNDFRRSLSKIGGTEPPPPPTSGEKAILQVRIISDQ